MTKDEVKEIRKCLGLTQSAFAEVCGVTCRTVQKWEAGDVIPPAMVKMLLSLRAEHEASSSNVSVASGDGSVAGIGNHVTQSSEVSRFLSLLEKKDVQFDRLLSELAAQRRQIDHLLGLKSDSNA